MLFFPPADGYQRFVFFLLCRKNTYFVEISGMKGNNRPVWCIALDPVPLITSNFPLQETFGSLNVGVLQIPRACMCVSVECAGV